MMSLIQFIKKNNLAYITFIVCVILMVLKIHWLPPFMIALVLFWYAESKNELSWDALKHRKPTRLLMLFLMLFVWQIFGLMLADSFASGFERIYKRASFVLFPVALFYPTGKIRDNVKLILRIFTISLLIYFCYCLGNATVKSIVQQDGSLIFRPYDPVYTWESYYTGLHLGAGFHPNYLSMYCLLGIIVSLETSFESDRTRASRFFWIIASFVLIGFVILLSTRSGMLSVIIVLPIFLLMKFYNRFPLWIIGTAIVVFVFLFSFFALTNSRIKYTVDNFTGNKIENVLESDVRLNIWKAAMSVIKENAIIGVGTGNASKELKKEFLQMGYSDGYYEGLNAHNQFLEILLENGIIGLLIFSGILIYTGYVAISDRNQILLIYLLTIIIFFTFESMLNRLAGVMFYPLFTFLLLHLRTEK